jgi:zinc protease
VVKRGSASPVVAAKIVYLAPWATMGPSEAGIEAAALALMARGPESMSYEDLQALLYARSSSIGYSASHFDASSLDLVTLGKYFSELFPIFAECAARPALDPAQWEQVISALKISYSQAMSDPYNAATAWLHEDFFAGHPYAADFQGSQQSLEAMSLDSVKAYLSRAMLPARMLVVVVGEVDPAEVKAMAEAALGGLRGGSAPAEPAQFTAKAGLIKRSHPAAKGVAYVRGDFPLPGAADPRYYASALAMSVLSDLVNDQVRTRNGACYSAWASYRAFEAGYGSLGVYRTSSPGAVRAYIDEAVAALLRGEALSSDGSYAPLGEVLDAYKAKFVSASYSGQQTNLALAQSIALSVAFFGDPARYAELRAGIETVSADDVVAAARSLLQGVPASWIVVGDEALLAQVSDEAYLAPLGQGSAR